MSKQQVYLLHSSMWRDGRKVKDEGEARQGKGGTRGREEVNMEGWEEEGMEGGKEKED